jgi:demethylmenaquinone methyltransferase/2-methoxy-6-polyprenyl-1,4-benzoquinol methylase
MSSRFLRLHVSFIDRSGGEVLTAIEGWSGIFPPGTPREEALPLLKDSQVKRMFEDIAFSYDFQTSFLSLGRDIQWRKILARSVLVKPGSWVLDMATGTAEIAIEICRQNPGGRAVGLDYSPRMVAIGAKKVKKSRLENCICLSIGDARSLPFENECFDAVTMGFGIRNIQEREQVLAEFRRVLKPEGRLAIMEFDYPDGPLMRALYRFYFHRVLPPVGNWLSRTDYAYSYLVDSVRAFPRPKEFLKEMEQAGFNHLQVKNLTWGIARIYSGKR